MFMMLCKYKPFSYFFLEKELYLNYKQKCKSDFISNITENKDVLMIF